MDTLNILQFVEEVFNSMNVYQSLIVYDSLLHSPTNINELVDVLKSNDFPVRILNSHNVCSSNEDTSARMFVVTIHDLKNMLDTPDMTKISVVFCLGNTVMHELCEVIKQIDSDYLHEMHLFSC